MANYLIFGFLKKERDLASHLLINRPFKPLLSLLLCCLSLVVHAQESIDFKDQRAEENYISLKDSSHLLGQEAIKFIPLAKDKSAYLSIGGSFRPRFEHFTNDSWIAGNNLNYYTHRLAFHTDFHLGRGIRLFGELQHGYRTDGEIFLQTDDLDIHQGFIEFKTAGENPLTFRLGRQEMKLGVGRLVDLRVGPNVRRAFDLGKVSFQQDQFHIDAFYGKEANINFGVFDNDFTLFEEGATNPILWGIYSQFLVSENMNSKHSMELYYLGFQSDFSAFSDVTGEETRHSIGLRSFGSINHKFQFNTEFIYQFGDLAGNTISAFNFETDWKYTISAKKWRPTIGVKLDWSSGDRDLADGRLNSFNPMFVNPGMYSLAAVNTPVNLLSFHPSLLLFPSRKWLINVEYAFFYRSTVEDGFYSPPRIQTRPVNGITARHLGNVIGLFLEYEYNRNAAFDVRSSYFIPASFMKESGASASIFQLASTITLTF